MGEDLDRDNDGIRDIDDACPVTPMHYTFVSNPVSDFDGDGCADGIEDTDNDNDNILNDIDHCPKTFAGSTTDVSGCSERQLALRNQEIDFKWWEVLHTECKGLALGERHYLLQGWIC